MKQYQRIGFDCLHFPCSVLLLILALTAGCSSRHARLTVRPAGGDDRIYSQTFDQAFVTRSVEGEYDVVLIEDGVRAQAPPQPGQPLTASPAAPMSQVAHIRVFWRPLPGTKSDHPSATNAALDWYVFGDGADRGRNMLHYSGAGFVTVSPTKHGAKLAIRNANLILKEQRGQMTDPIGPARINGSIVAVTDPDAVREQIAQIGQVLSADADSPQAAVNYGAPARTHAGP